MPVPVPKIRFESSVESTRYGVRVRFAARCDATHYTRPFEVVAGEDGVTVFGRTPPLSERSLAVIAEVTGTASVLAEAIRSGMSAEAIREVLRRLTAEREEALSCDI